MSNRFEIDVQFDPQREVDSPQRIAVRCDGVTLTRLLRPREKEPDDYLMAPPAHLAVWLAENWWRLRWECVPPGDIEPVWRLAHEMSSIGAGYAWPQASIWSEGDRIGIFARPDPSGVVGPARFLATTLTFIPAAAFEMGVDRFFEIVCSERAEGTCLETLNSLLSELTAERGDPEIADWRRLEAQLGFDPDKVPEALMKALAALIDRYGRAGVEEAVMAEPGLDAPKILDKEIAAARASHWNCNFAHALKAVESIQHRPTDPPWVAAEAVARSLRVAMGVESLPLKNRLLAELLGVSDRLFRSVNYAEGNLPYGIRVRTQDGTKETLALRSRASRDRRFEAARALGDTIWAASDPIGPLAKSKTARQKFQRAFAQSLLCPFDDLMGYFRTDRPTEEDVTAAAQHFHVSERVIQTVLVNKHVVKRVDFFDMVEAA